MNNQTAFPSTHHNGWGEPEKGMALRDYFAAKAMQSILVSIKDKDDMAQAVAETAYKWADAMLEARNG